MSTQIYGELLCYKEPWGTRAEWKGGRYATIDDRWLHYHVDGPIAVDRVFKVGGIPIRVIAREVSYGTCWDAWTIARAEDPVAWLRSRYIRAVNNGLHFIFRCEAAVMGFRLKYREGERARFTGWLADRLL